MNVQVNNVIPTAGSGNQAVTNTPVKAEQLKLNIADNNYQVEEKVSPPWCSSQRTCMPCTLLWGLGSGVVAASIAGAVTACNPAATVGSFVGSVAVGGGIGKTVSYYLNKKYNNPQG